MSNNENDLDLFPSGFPGHQENLDLFPSGFGGTSDKRRTEANWTDYIKSPAIGGLEGYLGNIASIINSIPQGIQSYPGIMGALTEEEMQQFPRKNIPQPNFQEMIPDTTVNNALYHGGKFGGSVAGGLGVEKGLKSLGFLNQIGNSRFKRILGDIARGGAAGYLTGEEGPGGRAGSAAIGSIAGGAANLFSKQRPIERLLEGKEQAFKPANAEYNTIREGLKGNEGNVKHLPINWEALSKEIPNKTYKGMTGLNEIKDLVKQGTFDSINKAQSKIFEWQRYLVSKSSAGGAVTKSLNDLAEAERNLHGGLWRKFTEVNPELSSKYQKANELFAQASKKFQSPALKEFESILAEYGPKAPSRSMKTKLINDLLADEDFMMRAGNQFPELAISNLYSGPMQKLSNLFKKGK